MVTVSQYETEDGRCPFNEWFESLDAKATATIVRMEHGNQGDVKPVGAGVSERRINDGPGYRLYFRKDGNALVLLLVGETKKGQSRDIETAKSYWAEYKKRKQRKK